MFARPLNGFGKIGRLDDGDVVAKRREHVAKALSEQCVVVGDQNVHGVGAPSPTCPRKSFPSTTIARLGDGRYGVVSKSARV